MKLGTVRRLLVDMPGQAKLAYCLMRDERVPPAAKVALLGSLGLIVSPLDLPAWIPFVGEFDLLAVGLLAVRVFVDACPDDLVDEHRTALRRKQSRFHEDLGQLRGLAQLGAARVLQKVQERAGWGPLRFSWVEMAGRLSRPDR